MRMLFDENLSDRLPRALVDLFPISEHVRNIGMSQASDTAVWAHAEEHGFTIISKDADFHQRSLVRGHPPKVIWIRCGNCSTKEIEQLVRENIGAIRLFEADNDASFFILS